MLPGRVLYDESDLSELYPRARIEGKEDALDLFKHCTKATERLITQAFIKVINAGIPGHARFESFSRFYAEAHVLQPDYVILYNAWNDMKYFSMEAPMLRTIKPYNELKEFRSNYQGWFDRALSEISQLYERLMALYFNRTYRIGPEGIIENGDYTREVNDISLREYRLNVKLFVDLARSI